MATADLCLRISDAMERVTSRQNAEFPSTANIPELAVCNKVDLVPLPEGLGGEGLKVSAKTGQGLPAVVESILSRLVGTPPSPGVGVPFTSRHCAIIDEAQQAVELIDCAGAIAALHRL